MSDARFEDYDSGDRPLRLVVAESDDLPVVSALIQDAVGQVGEISWMPKRRRLVLVLNRFRWEDTVAAEKDRRPYQRVRSALVFDGVLAVQTNGPNPADKDMVYSVLQARFDPADDGAGAVVLELAGDGALVLDVECLDGRLIDVSVPWDAKSGSAPEHPLD